MRELKITRTDWPVRGEFRIARGALTEIPVISVEITEAGVTGRGECRPYDRYHQTCESVRNDIEALRSEIEAGLSRDALQHSLAAGAARNAVDCALWDLEAKHTKQPVWDKLGLAMPRPRNTAFTLSVAPPETMAIAAKAAAEYQVLKLKINGREGIEKAARAVHCARPEAGLIIDANESLSGEDVGQILEALHGLPVLMIEQPIAAKNNTKLHLPANNTIPICADESLHNVDDLPKLKAAGYDAVNVKLDKCGGLTEAVTLMRAAKTQGFKIMAGCMASSSLAVAPMMMLESFADVIDLDGPALLARDIEHGLHYAGGKVFPPVTELWG